MDTSAIYSKEIIKKAICQYVAINNNDNLPESLLKKLFSCVETKYLSDREILGNDRIKELIDWNSLEKNQIIRLIVRDKMVLEKIDIDVYNFEIKDLIPIFLRHPDLIEFFSIDFENLGPIEAINMLDINASFIEKIELEKYNYDRNQINSIIKKFSKHDAIINKLNLSELDHFVIRNILIQSGEKLINKVDLNKLKQTDWIEILKNKPELISYCNLSIFEKNDCYGLVNLVKIFPEYDYLIFNNANKISAIGWEKLLILDPDKYSPYCNFNLLSSKSWDIIIDKHPEMSMHRVKYRL